MILLEADRTCRLNTRGDFPYPQQHLKVDNTDMEPEVVAHRTVEHCRLTRIGGVTLRQAAASAAEAIHELHLDSVRTLCASSYPEILEAWLKDRTADGYLHGIEADATFVAEIGSTTIGFCETIAVEVVAVFVSPQYAGRSVGTTLVSLALDIATRGRRLVQLESTAQCGVVLHPRGLQADGRIDRSTQWRRHPYRPRSDPPGSSAGWRAYSRGQLRVVTFCG